MHSELSYGLSFAPKLQRVGTIHLSGSDQPTPDPSFSRAAATELRRRRCCDGAAQPSSVALILRVATATELMLLRQS